ncbi:unnamed protein product [Lasius platythorax]|uniref:Uncharacterized protein n=1 Tax=Lasius platythorax TaxID=488582 RepID=A0AAV2NXW9_9HYME
MPNEANRQHIQPEVLAAVADTLKTWHEKMAHQNFRHVKRVLNQFQIKVKDIDKLFVTHVLPKRYTACHSRRAHQRQRKSLKLFIQMFAVQYRRYLWWITIFSTP